MLNKAVEWELLDESPMRRLKFLKENLFLFLQKRLLKMLKKKSCQTLLKKGCKR